MGMGIRDRGSGGEPGNCSGGGVIKRLAQGTDTRTECRLSAFEVAYFVAVVDFFFGLGSFGLQKSQANEMVLLFSSPPFAARLRCVLIALKCL